MATYNYTAKDANGNALVGTYDNINSVALLRQELGKMGYVLVKARKLKNSTPRFIKIKQTENKWSEHNQTGHITCLHRIFETPSKLLHLSFSNPKVDPI